MLSLTAYLLIAVSFWGARGVEVPCHPQITHVSAATWAAWDANDRKADPTWPGAYMRATACKDGGKIYLSRQARRDRRRNPTQFCRAFIHEMGHVAGLGHAPGVMDARGNGHLPWVCVDPKGLWRHYVLSVPDRTADAPAQARAP